MMEKNHSDVLNVPTGYAHADSIDLNSPESQEKQYI